ncbi:MAG: T9SS type A sorting domain-containing protein [Bacteroidetes bacterium]|nr:T9SS type A sorting domain-containing protein [Bacteroidota bacterium]
MKKIIFKTQFVIASLLLVMIVNAQTVTTTDQVFSGPDFGTTVLVPINSSDISSNYGNIIIATIPLDFDINVLTYVGYTNLNASFPPLNISVTPNGSAGELQFNIEDQAFVGFAWPDGKILDIQFTFLGGQTTINLKDVEFLDEFFTSYYPPMVDGSVEGYTTLTGSNGDWDAASTWTGYLGGATQPGLGHDVTISDGTSTTVTVDANGTCNSLTVNAGGQLTLNSGISLSVATDLLVKSGSGGNGSFINSGGTLNVTGTTSVQSYVTAGQWHGISSPVTGLTANDLYLGGSPNVWLKSYNESDDTYTSITELSQSLGNMEGWMTWIASGNQTYTFTGDFRTGPVSRSVTHSGNGFNFVGNPFTSAIDWDAASGWTRTNVNNATYVYNNGTWASYISSVGSNGGSQYIAMNQGFFVQASAAGSLAMTSSVCVHNAVTFKNQMDAGQIIRLELTDADLTDETVIRIIDGATTIFDGNLDAHKFFSFNTEYPQIFSTANDFMSINSLPEANEAIGLDVSGADGNSMTISVTEALDFDNLYLKDELTGQVTNLKVEDYTFTYNADISNRFNLFFSITDVTETPENDIMIFAYDQTIQVNLEGFNQTNISVYNLLGQEIATVNANANQVLIPIFNSGYYVVKVADGNRVSTQKVFIK